MISNPVLYKIVAAIMVVTILSGCTVKTAGTVPTSTPVIAPTTAPAATTAVPSETIAPTVDQNLVETQSAQTVVANMTLSAPTVTLVPPTGTATAAPTITLIFTPAPPTARPTATFFPFKLTPTNTPTGYACFVTSTSPKSTDTLKVNTNFDLIWVIKNTGVKLWGHANADLKYISGTAMQTGGGLYDLASDVGPGASYTATISMKTPATAGTYTAVWEIVQDSVLVCTLNLSVKVIK